MIRPGEGVLDDFEEDAEQRPEGEQPQVAILFLIQFRQAEAFDVNLRFHHSLFFSFQPAVFAPRFRARDWLFLPV